MYKKILFLIFVGVLVIYWPSLFTFYTNDDFFHLKISNADSGGDFLNFFNLLKAPDGFGFYRPLTTQVFYFLATKIFSLSPLPLHLLSFIVFFGGAYLTYQLALILSRNQHISILTCFLYSFSAIHFAHFYFLGTFQELGLFFFAIYSALFFTRYLENNKIRDYLLSLGGFILSLLTKETAVVLPPVLFLIWAYLKIEHKVTFSTKKLFKVLLPFLIILGVYLYLHVYFYGLPTGDSYFTDYSFRKTLNSLMWYFLWVLGIPEMFVDFVGPGIKINPNLFKFWGSETAVIFGLFGASLLLLGVMFVKSIKGERLIYLVLFSLAFFILTLMPVLFFPFHKFSYNLTLPSFAIFFFIATVMVRANLNYYFFSFYLITFFALNIVTISLTKKTHWITRGAETAYRVYNFFEKNAKYYKGKVIVFYDTPQDSELPWSPTNLVKGVLSDQNFFDVLYLDSFKIIYGKNEDVAETVQIPSRMFLGY